MLQKTHSAAGLVAAETILVAHDVPFLSWTAAGALLLGCLAGTIADVDKPGSTMAKVLFPLSALLRFLNVRHRTATHSALCVAALWALTLPLPALYRIVFVAAYASHPIIDLFNEKGVQLLWPLKLKIRLLPAGDRYGLGVGDDLPLAAAAGRLVHPAFDDSAQVDPLLVESPVLTGVLPA